MSSITTNGYVMEYVAGRGRVFVHIHVAEKAFGKSLPPRAEVHHWNENKQNNVGSNLVICPDETYHTLLHQRTKAFEACGNANYRKCCFYQQWDDPVNLMIRGGAGSISYRHRACYNKANRDRYQRIKQETDKQGARNGTSTSTQTNK